MGVHLASTAPYHRVETLDVDGNSQHPAGGMQSVGLTNHELVRIAWIEMPAVCYRAQTEIEPKPPLQGGRYKSDGLADLAKPDHLLK